MVLPISSCAIAYESGGGVWIVCSVFVVEEWVLWFCGGGGACVEGCGGWEGRIGSALGGC